MRKDDYLKLQEESKKLFAQMEEMKERVQHLDLELAKATSGVTAMGEPWRVVLDNGSKIELEKARVTLCLPDIVAMLDSVSIHDEEGVREALRPFSTPVGQPSSPPPPESPQVPPPTPPVPPLKPSASRIQGFLEMVLSVKREKPRLRIFLEVQETSKVRVRPRRVESCWDVQIDTTTTALWEEVTTRLERATLPSVSLIATQVLKERWKPHGKDKSGKQKRTRVGTLLLRSGSVISP